MKAVAWVFLTLFVLAPLLVAAWWLFPLVAGFFAWLLLKYKDAKYWGRFAKPASLFVLACFVIWLIFVPRGHLIDRPYESSKGAALVTLLANPSAQPSEELQRSERERRRLIDAIGREQLKVAEIATALELYSSADEVFVNRNRNGITDDSNLGGALADLHRELEPHKLNNESNSSDLLLPANLKTLVERASGSLDKVLKDALSGEIGPDQMNEKQNQLPKLVSEFQLDAIYGRVASLENALRQALKVNLTPRSTCTFDYDRSADILKSEQRILISLSDQQPVAIDMSGLLSPSNDPFARSQITIREDSDQEREVDPKIYKLPLHSETKQITVIRRVYRSSASYPLITDRIWIPFRGVTLRWTIPLTSSIVLSMRFREDPSISWPLTVQVRTDPADAVEAIRIPRHSFFYADAPLTPVFGEQSDVDRDQLAPEKDAPKLADLATDKSIRLEFLPRYLSNSIGQRFKEYLGIENLLSAIIIALFTSLGLAIVNPPK